MGIQVSLVRYAVHHNGRESSFSGAAAHMDAGAGLPRLINLRLTSDDYDFLLLIFDYGLSIVI
jgi:hypothetical protein